jgi:hypothetical protein
MITTSFTHLKKIEKKDTEEEIRAASEWEAQHTG